MKVTILFGLLTLGLALVSPSIMAQDTRADQPKAGTQLSNDREAKKAAKRAKKAQKKRNRSTDQNNRTDNDGTTNESSTYRQGAMTDGTMLNNSNISNYNSQNVTTAPTGVGSVPQATDVVPDNTSVGTASPNMNKRSGTPTGAAVAGAITTAPTVPPSMASPSTSVGDFMSAQPDYTTLQNALQTVDLDKELRGAGPYTVLAPSNSAFKKLPTVTQNTLLEGRNQDMLKQLLHYHIINGTIDGKELARQINAGGGKAILKTMAGKTITAQIGSNNRIMLTDETGKTAYVDAPDQQQANGVVHGITNVLMPTDVHFK